MEIFVCKSLFFQLQKLIFLLEVTELTYDRKLCLIESLRRCNMSAIEIHNIVETAWSNEAGTVRSIQKICYKH